MPAIESFMPPLDQAARLGSLFFTLYAVAIGLCFVLPWVRKSTAYKNAVAHLKPGIALLGWLLIFMGAGCSIRDICMHGYITNILFFGLCLIVMGIHIVKIGYEDAARNGEGATNLKIVSVSVTFSVAFVFLEMCGSTLERIFK